MPTVKLVKKEGCRRELNIAAEPELVKKSRDEVVNQLAREAELPGFRAGKIPAEVIEQRFKDEIKQKVVEKIVPETYRQAVLDQQLDPVSPPEIASVELEGDRLAYTAVLDVAPAIELESYGGLTMDKEDTDVTEQEVNRVLDDLLTRNPQLQNQAADLSVREKYKKDIRQRLEWQKETEAAAREDEKLIDQLLEKVKMDVPEIPVNRRTIEMVRRELSREVSSAGKEIPREEQEKKAKELFAKLKPVAEREVKAAFVLSEIARREKIEVSDEEADKRVEVLARMYGKDKEKVKADFDEEKKEELKFQLKLEKTLALLKKRCVVVDKPRIITP